MKIELDTGQMYCINGVRIQFPVKAYPTQITMMNKVLQGIERKQHCLLESPTGSGKSLALLCSCLAWQNSEKARIVAQAVEEEDPCVDGRKTEPKNDVCVVVKDETMKHDNNEDGDEDDFVPLNKKRRKSLARQEQTVNEKSPQRDESITSSHVAEWKMEVTTVKSSPEEKKKSSPSGSREKLPKIYFGTRTHKQIAQIVRELRKTMYSDVKMTILGSREHLCIHPTVSKSKDKNEECQKLVKGLEGRSCRFHGNVQLFNKYNVKLKYKINTAFDIEDLVSVGKKLKACPYFGSRELTKGAEIIFCPYNYLIDPIIRSQMMINLKDQVVVLDEAHNIEDSAREAASVSVTMLQIEESRNDLQDLISGGVMIEQHTCLQMLCDGLLSWIHERKDSLESRGFEEDAKVWDGNEMVKMLREQKSLQLTSTSFKIYKNQLTAVISDQESTNNDEAQMRASSKTIACLSSIMLGLEKLLDEEHDYAADYRVALCRTSGIGYKSLQGTDGWLKKSKGQEKVWTYKLNMWCLNPAVVFAEIGQNARCIILSSGTLSPINSFSSELGVNFPIQLEANHVIQDEQVWVGNLTVGPSNRVINANFKNSETYTFQDDVGDIIMQICQTIPKGVLCFFPSYSMLEKLVKRWKGTGLWERLSMCKVVLIEPRGGDKKDFDETLNRFYESVKVERKTECDALDGALLLAVCRGKISEGLDFSDNNARAVLTVGIPFPNVKDTQVELKRKYNNQHSRSRGLLTGNEWYEIQAFRALNQALGRCIRHRNDWGALLVIDERFSKSSKYINGLSKWVRSKVKLYTDFQTCLTSMCHFANERLSCHVTATSWDKHETADTILVDHEKPRLMQQSPPDLLRSKENPNHDESVKSVDPLSTDEQLLDASSILLQKPKHSQSKRSKFAIKSCLIDDTQSHVDHEEDALTIHNLNDASFQGECLSQTLPNNQCVNLTETNKTQSTIADDLDKSKLRIKRFSFRTPGSENKYMFWPDVHAQAGENSTKSSMRTGLDMQPVKDVNIHEEHCTQNIANDVPGIADSDDADMFLLSTQLLATGTPERCKVNNSSCSRLACNEREKSHMDSASLENSVNALSCKKKFIYPRRSLPILSLHETSTSSEFHQTKTSISVSGTSLIQSISNEFKDKKQLRSNTSLNTSKEYVSAVALSPPLLPSVVSTTNNKTLLPCKSKQSRSPSIKQSGSITLKRGAMKTLDSPDLFASDKQVDMVQISSEQETLTSKRKTTSAKDLSLVNETEQTKPTATVSLNRKRKNLRSSFRNTSFNHSTWTDIEKQLDDQIDDFNLLAQDSNELIGVECRYCKSLITSSKVMLCDDLMQMPNRFLNTLRKVYLVINNPSCCSLVKKTTLNTDAHALNSYFDDVNRILYIPLYCETCLLSLDQPDRIMGFKILNWKQKRAAKVYIYADSVKETNL